MILLPSVVAVGEIYCRVGGDAGHFTLPDICGMPTTLGGPASINCYYGSSRPACVTQYGCNEQYAMALCCAPTPTCGNGLVDSPEEDCDDGNPDETDDCLNSCAWRIPGAHGYVGTSCN
jgi:cysteine-rich repeat protein